MDKQTEINAMIICQSKDKQVVDRDAHTSNINVRSCGSSCALTVFKAALGGVCWNIIYLVQSSSPWLSYLPLFPIHNIWVMDSVIVLMVCTHVVATCILSPTGYELPLVLLHYDD